MTQYIQAQPGWFMLIRRTSDGGHRGPGEQRTNWWEAEPIVAWRVQENYPHTGDLVPVTPKHGSDVPRHSPWAILQPDGRVQTCSGTFQDQRAFETAMVEDYLDTDDRVAQLLASWNHPGSV